MKNNYREKYTIRYGNITATDIFNMTSGEFLPDILKVKVDWWLPENRRKLKKINTYYIDKFNEFNKHYIKVEESILKEGFRNPIIITSGLPQRFSASMIPPEEREKGDSLLISEVLGGSRLRVAQKYNMMIPCIINDFSDNFDTFVELKTEQDILNNITDPHRISFTNSGVLLAPLNFYHLHDDTYTVSTQAKERKSIVNDILIKLKQGYFD